VIVTVFLSIEEIGVGVLSIKNKILPEVLKAEAVPTAAHHSARVFLLINILAICILLCAIARY
jgi:hypothetical protein